ncbi:MAG TPA: DUF4038 domain-containing protein, partial [Bryobacteraceae bacterium]|nr:DUF4038 domain-containing protein [Bryobacteraceae bacterium]
LEADVPGYIKPANGHHWRYTHSRGPHLWMGDTSYGMAWLDKAAFERMAERRGEQGFNHIRGYAIGRADFRGATFKSPEQPDHSFYRVLDERIQFLNSKGMFFDAILGHDRNHLREAFPTRTQRERYLRYMVARYSAFHVTWQITQEFEEYDKSRELMKEMGDMLKRMDPYGHPRSAHSLASSSPLSADGWMDYLMYQSPDDALGAIEHQLHALPAVNAGFAFEDSGAGKTDPHHVDSDTFRRRLWNATMNGQYPVFGNTGTYGSTKLAYDDKHLSSPGSAAMTAWQQFMSKTRFWELEPYFDLDGGRALALPGVEYIVYVENPSGPIEIRLEKRGYDVRWMNPATGELTPVKDFRSDKFVIDPPSSSHDWILHISSDGRKESMLRSYKFESRPFLMQEVEMARTRAPFEISLPSADEVSASKPAPYEVKPKRESRGTRSMMYLWTGEVATVNSGARVLGTGPSGTLKVPREFAPGVMNMRVYGMNALGKVYAVDRILQVLP